MDVPNTDGLKYFFPLSMLLLFGFGYGFNEFLKWSETNDVIISKIKIEPEIQLTIQDNKVDTLYIYRYEK